MTQLFADSFVRANESPLNTGNYTAGAAINGVLQVVSNLCENGGNSSANSRSWVNSVSFPNDQYSQITVKAVTANAGVGCLVRASGTAGSDTAYGLITEGAVGTCTLGIIKWLSGAFNSITTSSITLALNDTLMLEVQGTTLSWYHNGTLVSSTTDSSISSGAAGLMAYVNSGLATDAALNGFSAGNLLGSNPWPLYRKVSPRTQLRM